MELKIFSNKNFFVVTIPNKLLNSDVFIRHCAEAETFNKPMYAIVKNGVDWDEFKRFVWRKTYFFDTDQEYNKVWDELRADFEFYMMVQTHGKN